MGLIRLVLLAILAAGAWWLWRKVKRLSAKDRDNRLPQATPMVRCEHCQLHLPQPSAIRHQDRWYCSDAHAKADTKNHE